jgi:hypothetical protein
MSEDYIYTYNAACVYGRALERLLKQPHTPERDQEVDRYRAKSIADLRRSIKLGFPDLDWMKKDSDLDSLHDVPEFKKIVSQDTSSDESRLPNNPGKGVPQPGKKKPQNDGTNALRGGTSNLDSLKSDLLFENARP